MFKFKNK